MKVSVFMSTFTGLIFSQCSVCSFFISVFVGMLHLRYIVFKLYCLTFPSPPSGVGVGQPPATQGFERNPSEGVREKGNRHTLP